MARGGDGTSGNGGTGGYFEAYTSAGADLRIERSGAASASFAVNYVKPNLGSHPLTVSADIAVKPDEFSRVRGDDGEIATGIWVKPGATLTLEPYTGSDVYVVVSNGIYLEGTLTSTRLVDGVSAASVQLEGQNFVATTDAVVDLSGLSSAEDAGGAAGDFNVFTAGTILSGAHYALRGGDGSDGGDGGDLDLESYYYGIWLEGDVDASGGHGSTGYGGAGGSAALYGSQSGGVGSWGGAFARGDFATRGGDGALGGGDGGDFYVSAYYNGSTKFSGTVDASGGDATDAAQNGTGGHAGAVGSDTWTGDAILAGRWTARGGNGVGSGWGGQGGYTFAELSDDDQTFGGLISGVIQVSVDIDVSGGGGATGGGAGDVYVENDPSYVREPGAQTTELLGYESIDLSGGAGATGGDAGWMYVRNLRGFMVATIGTPPNESTVPSTVAVLGGLRLEADVFARGGPGANGDGGWGGSVDVSTYYFQDYAGTNLNSIPAFDRQVVVTSHVDTSGGDGSVAGGWAGDVFVYEHYFVEASGTITAKGGAGGSGDGGGGGDVQVVGDTRVERSGSTTTAGGASAEANGGAAGDHWVWGFLASASGNVDASGGAAAGFGGQGGFVDVLSTGQATPFSGTVNVAGGAGATAGDEGVCQIDGVQVALTSGEYTR